MYLTLHDYGTGKEVLVNMDNIIRVQDHAERLGKQDASHIGSRLLSVMPQGRGTSTPDPFPIDVKETVQDIKHMIY